MTAPATAICANIFGARIVRATLVDGCGRPVYGPQSQVVTDGFTAVEIGNEIEQGEEISLRNAAGENCFPPTKNPDQIKWHTVKVTFCKVDPAMFLLWNRTWKRVTNARRDTTTGWRGSLKFSDAVGIALELWPKVGAGASQICIAEDVPDPDLQVNGYALFPWIIAQAPDNLTFENSPTTFALNGISKVGGLWGRGPYNVTRDLAGQPAPLLDPIDPGFDVPIWDPPFVSAGDPDPYHFEYVTVKPPAPSCGAKPLWNQNATAPQISVAADGANTRTPVLTVSNFAAVGSSGTVAWGDGTSQPVPAASNGVVTKADPYAPELDGQEQTITFTAGNGAAPVTATFTPQAPTEPVISVEADGANTRTPVLTVSNFAAVGSSGTVAWGDGTSQPVPPASNGTVTKTDPYDAGLDGQEQTITFTAGNGSDPVTAAFTPQAPAQTARRGSRGDA